MVRYPGILNVMTIDVEEWFHILDTDAPTVAHARWDALESRVVDNTSRLLAILKSYGAHATFFFLGWVANRFPNLVRQVANEGHDVASHGYSHALVHQSSPQEFEQDLMRSISAIEEAAQKPVLGYRAAGFSVTPKTPWVFPMLARHGIRYDASVFPALHGHGGFPNAPKHPFLLKNGDGTSLLEFPASAVTIFGRTLPFGGGGYLRLLPTPVITGAIRWLNNADIPATIYLHPREIDPNQPRIAGLPCMRRAKYYVNLRHTEAKLRELLQQFSFTSIERFLDEPSNRRRMENHPHELRFVSPAPQGTHH